MIRSDAGRCPVSAQCGILGVAKSTCYWVLEHPEAERADPYEKDVERVWRDSGKVYGARKIRHALGHEGVTLSRRRINRIMKGNGMAGSCSKAAYRPRPARPNDDPAPDILAREFNGYAPRTHLASDPAYVRVGSSWAYVCLPGDLASRQIAGHSVGVGHDADLVLAAFAALRFPLDEIEVFHTDRGGEFAGERVERVLDVFGITRSLSRPGNPYDNAVVESTCISSSRCFVFSHVFFSGLGSCMHFPYFSGCAEVFLPNMRASLTRRLWPVNSRSRPWCTMRSMIAAASLSSAKTVPHLLNSMFVVNMMLRLS